MKNFGFNLYLFFTVSWFLHLSARFSVLGSIRFDLILVLILFCISFIGNSNQNYSDNEPSKTEKILIILIAYIILSIPFVEWPGSVLNRGITNFTKAIVFYFFTVKFVVSETKLKKFIYTFLLCQFFRVAEPVFLHITEGYWGAMASMHTSTGMEFMDRLAGSPYDIINPNGLAFVIDMILPFLYFIFFVSWKNKIFSSILIPVCIYALVLTGSRSGMLAFGVIIGMICLKSRKKILFAIIAVLSVVVIFLNLSAELQDRYFSIFSSHTKNAATAEGRLSGITADFKVAMRRPIFGHGLGTSLEANANFGGKAQVSHNLFTEVWQELGFIGLIIFLLLIESILSNYLKTTIVIKNTKHVPLFLFEVNNAMQTWLIMNILFAFASYGLSTYEWYLFAGLSVVLLRIVKEETAKVEVENG